MKVLKIERPDAGNNWIGLSKEQTLSPSSYFMEEINLMFTDDEIGSVIKLTLIEMTDEEFAKLQEHEFQGW